MLTPGPNMMPTCKLHQDQLKPSALCRVPLPCGFECARLCVWRPHSYSRCPTHIDCPMTCYFLKIPIELRVRIYGYVLPDLDIPANWQYHSDELRSDNNRTSICMGLLRVNRQIHDEAIGLLYGCRTFTIQLSGSGLSMCNSLQRQSQQNPNPPGSHSLQDYQMQLMLLEQQNKRRLLMARNHTSSAKGPSTTRQYLWMAGNHASSTVGPPTTSHSNSGAGPMNPFRAQTTCSTLPTMPLASASASTANFPIVNTHSNDPSIPNFLSMVPPVSEPDWDTPLSSKYFNQIQSFRIEICLPLAPNQSTIQNYYNPGTRNTLPDVSSANADLEFRIYEYSDYLHMLVSRLQTTHRRLSRLEIMVRFGDMYYDRNEDTALSAMDILIRPFRRLCNVGSTEVLATRLMTIPGSDEKQEVPYLINNITPQPKSKASISVKQCIAEASESLNEYLATFCDSLSATSPSLTPSPAFHTYWRLDALLSKMTQHCHHTAAMSIPDLKAGFDQFGDLRRRARVAREDEDLESFKAMFGLVRGIWQRYLDWEKWFQESVWGDIQGVWDVVAEGKM